jgi:regulator of RNase E activity RraB
MFGGGYKKKKILKLAEKYASVRELGWETYYREMSGLLK